MGGINMHSIFRLPASEFHRYKTHLLSLDNDSKLMRFGYQVKTETILELSKKWAKEPEKHVIFGIENDDLELVGVGHICLEEQEPELAFSVLKEYQNQGMGSALMARCVEWCRNRDLKTGTMICLSTNTAIKKLASRHGILVRDGSETLAEIKIPEANVSSIVHEIVEDNLSTLSHIGKAQRKFAKILGFPLRF